MYLYTFYVASKLSIGIQLNFFISEKAIELGTKKVFANLDLQICD